MLWTGNKYNKKLNQKWTLLYPTKQHAFVETLQWALQISCFEWNLFTLNQQKSHRVILFVSEKIGVLSAWLGMEIRLALQVMVALERHINIYVNLFADICCWTWIFTSVQITSKSTFFTHAVFPACTSCCHDNLGRNSPTSELGGPGRKGK